MRFASKWVVAMGMAAVVLVAAASPLYVGVEASGVVHHLASLRDFAGTYTEVEVPAALAGEGCTGAIENQHGVVIGLQSTTQGMRFNPSLLGVSIELGNGLPLKPD
jgi:hypothetical protein